MKRRLIIGILCILAALLQTTLLSYVEIASIRPNLPIILTVSFALMCGRTTGLAVGFFTGILLDFFGGGILGFYALIYSVIGYYAGYTYRIFYVWNLPVCDHVPDQRKDPRVLLSEEDHYT